jgi:putative Mg2+ transporter-C (MgtC) family protein
MTVAPTELDMALRLGAAIAFGAALGINRDLHHKAAGLRTHALVALGCALAVIAPLGITTPDGVSRVIQGLVTGIGFLGAGVIVHHEARRRVEGLTTAASIWGASILGLTCGVGRVALAGIATSAVMLVLVFGGPIERMLERRFGAPLSDPDDAETKPNANPPRTPPLS